jgi:hypothetical protein
LGEDYHRPMIRILLFFLFFSVSTSCSHFYKRGTDSKFYGYYRSVSPPISSFLCLQDNGQGYFLLSKNKSLPVLWSESLGVLNLTYLGQNDRYEEVRLVDETSESSLMGLQFVDRPDFPGPMGPWRLIKVAEVCPTREFANVQ